MAAFEKLGLSKWLASQLEAVGFREPTPVQQHCIPPILEGQDCLGCAKTGSGKTAAFALPILHKLAEDPYGIFALILTPTRELAFQIADQFQAFGKGMNVRDLVIVGGMDMMKQSLSLAEQPHVVIATPGRLVDHLRSTDTFSLKKVKFLVLDEADRLLDPSFQADLSVVLACLPRCRQTLLFSATLTDSLQRLKAISNHPFVWEAPAETATVEKLDQRYILMPMLVKDSYLVKLLQLEHDEEGKSLILFTHSCRSCQVYALLLRALDIPCVPLHSILSQSERLAALAKFRAGKVRVLVATDVASRGLDIPTVDVVVNSNVPASPKDYIHRVGRTARAGHSGLAVTMVTQYDVLRVKSIEAHTGVELREYAVEEEEVLRNLNAVSAVKKQVERSLIDSSFGERRRLQQRRRTAKETLSIHNTKRKKRKKQLQKAD